MLRDRPLGSRASRRRGVPSCGTIRSARGPPVPVIPLSLTRRARCHAACLAHVEARGTGMCRRWWCAAADRVGLLLVGARPHPFTQLRRRAHRVALLCHRAHGSGAPRSRTRWSTGPVELWTINGAFLGPRRGEGARIRPATALRFDLYPCAYASRRRVLYGFKSSVCRASSVEWARSVKSLTRTLAHCYSRRLYPLPYLSLPSPSTRWPLPRTRPLFPSAGTVRERFRRHLTAVATWRLRTRTRTD